MHLKSRMNEIFIKYRSIIFFSKHDRFDGKCSRLIFIVFNNLVFGKYDIRYTKGNRNVKISFIDISRNELFFGYCLVVGLFIFAIILTGVPILPFQHA